MSMFEPLLQAWARWAPGWARGPKSNPALSLVLDDLTERDVDAIVNAADWTMLGGTGVDGAIHAKAGRDLGAHIVSRRLALRVGEVHATPGFLLKAPHVLHTCAPTWQCRDDEDQDKALRLCYQACIRQADQMGLSSISFPLLGAGAFGWPTDEAARHCAQACQEAAKACRSLASIEICAFSPTSLLALETAFGLAGHIVADPATLRLHPGASALEHLTAAEIAHRF